MQRWTSLVGALLLVLTLWTGNAAHAARPTHCPPAPVEQLTNVDRQSDQAPSEKDNGVTHYHLGCGGHQIASQADLEPLILIGSRGFLPVARQDNWNAGEDPPLTLRPPIA